MESRYVTLQTTILITRNTIVHAEFQWPSSNSQCEELSNCPQSGSYVSDVSFLISDSLDEYIAMQFGRVGPDTFSMDVQYPLSIFQAFAVCLTAFDPKIMCE